MIKSLFCLLLTASLFTGKINDPHGVTVACNSCPATAPHSFLPFPAFTWVAVKSDPNMDKFTPGACNGAPCAPTGSPACLAERRFIVEITVPAGDSLYIWEVDPVFGLIPDGLPIPGPTIVTKSYALSTTGCGNFVEKNMVYTIQSLGTQTVSMKAVCGYCPQGEA
jgi:hypothetical protein